MKSLAADSQKSASDPLAARTASETPVRSPCVSICCLDENDICIGCYRSGDEICAWSGLNNDQRRAVLEQVAVREKASGRTL